MRKSVKLLVIILTIMIIDILFATVVMAQTAEVTGNVVNVRNGPGSNNVKVGVVTKGYKLNVLDQQGGWYKVDFGESRQGWVSGDLLKVEQTKKERWIKVTGNVVNARSGPATSFDIIKEVSAGETFLVIGSRGDWLEVKLNDSRHGWVANWLVAAAESGGSQDLVSNQQTEDPALGVIVISGEYVNVRSGPSTADAIINQMDKGTRLTALEENGGWYRVRLPDGKEGYLVNWLAELHKETVSDKAPDGGELKVAAVKISGSVVNVRSQPTTSSSVVAEVSKGEEYPALGKEGDWVKIRVKDQQGFIAAWLADILYAQSSNEDGEDLDKDKVANTQPKQDALSPKESESADKHVQKEQETGETKEFTQVESALITGSIVNVRSGPGLTNNRITKVQKGERYNVLGKKDDWLQIQLADSSSGWLAGWLASTSMKSVPTQPKQETDEQETDEQEENNAEPSESAEQGESEQQDSDQPAGSYIIAENNVTHLFAGPSRDFPQLKTLAKGDQVEVLASSADWYEVKLDDGSSGWLQRRALTSRGDSNRDDDKQEQAHQDDNDVDLPKQPNTIYAVEVSGTSELLITIKASSPMKYGVLRLDSPQRLVVDLEEQTLMESLAKEVSVGGKLVSRLRLGQFEVSTARLVVDLKDSAKYSVDYGKNEKELVISIAPPDLGGKVIVVDPGHGSSTPWGDADPGAIGYSGTYERVVVMNIARQLASMLESAGAQVVLTRNGQADISLPGRAAIANDIGADIFVSIHANTSPSRGLSGSSTYFYAPAVAGQRYQRQRLAGLIQDELISALGTADLGARQENFSVLRNTRVPSVLVETAFLSNPEEERKLNDDVFQKKAAQGIAQGIKRYLLDED